MFAKVSLLLQSGVLNRFAKINLSVYDAASIHWAHTLGCLSHDAFLKITYACHKQYTLRLKVFNTQLKNESYFWNGVTSQIRVCQHSNLLLSFKKNVAIYPGSRIKLSVGKICLVADTSKLFPLPPCYCFFCLFCFHITQCSFRTEKLCTLREQLGCTIASPFITKHRFSCVEAKTANDSNELTLSKNWAADNPWLLSISLNDQTNIFRVFFFLFYLNKLTVSVSKRTLSSKQSNY